MFISLEQYDIFVSQEKEYFKVKEIDANKNAWGLLSKDHYEYCKKALQEKRFIVK